MEKIFFAGGSYYPTEKVVNKKNGAVSTVSLTDKKKTFEAVCPTGGLPYLTHDSKGLDLLTNGNLYMLSEDGKHAILTEYRCMNVTPMEQHSDGSFWPAQEIVIPERVAEELQKAIQANHFYD